MVEDELEHDMIGEKDAIIKPGATRIEALHLTIDIPYTKTKANQLPAEINSSKVIYMGELSSDGYVSVDIPPAAAERPRVLHSVPTQVREGKNQIYEPVLVSLGPNHHQHDRGFEFEFEVVEDIKGEILNNLVPASSDNRKKLLDHIRSRLDDIRSFYGGLSSSSVDDTTLAEMMLRDACFVVYFMKNDEKCLIRGPLGMSRVAFVVRDIFKLENQLPFWILKLLKPMVSLKSESHHDDRGCQPFFDKFLSSMTNCNEGTPTLHLLHALRTTLVHESCTTTTETSIKMGINFKSSTNKINPFHWIFKSIDARTKKAKSQFRSVKDMKEKGIHFRPTSSCLKDIQFTSHSFYGKLRLPILSIDSNTNVIFSNIIAFEMSPGSNTDFAVISYVKFMKSLIEKPEDVKELREKGIILSGLANDEEVVKMFKEFNTDGSCSKDIFKDIREKINEHCRSKAKTFKAELIHTYFRSPWTAMALFVATLLLFVNCFNFFLNYYRMRRPIKRD
ncbi:hypothetical protein C2S51_013702 [Perilla frutescens var. frutescens]|nr:hypothetical protein C2S51_013702 [Perilla frutescens var. frutescens]